jgi:hypothetical protein
MMPLTLFRGDVFRPQLPHLPALRGVQRGDAADPYVLITSGGYSPVQAGLAMLPLPVLMTSISPTMGSLAGKIDPGSLRSAHWWLPADALARLIRENGYGTTDHPSRPPE